MEGCGAQAFRPASVAGNFPSSLVFAAAMFRKGDRDVVDKIVETCGYEGVKVSVEDLLMNEHSKCLIGCAAGSPDPWKPSPIFVSSAIKTY